MAFARSLNQTVEYDLETAVGHTASVYMSIPERGAGRGKIQVTVSGRMKTIDAISTADAEGEATRFELLLAEYEKAPRVTRERLYIEAIEEVYGRSSKVIIDTDGSGNLLYLPIEQLINRSGGSV